MSTSSFKTSSVSDRLLFLAKLLPGTSQILSSLIDSDADANLIDEELVRQLRINRVPLSKYLPELLTVICLEWCHTRLSQ